MSITPSYAEFCRRAKRGNVVPVWKEFPADLETPVSVFLKLGNQKPYAFLLESVELGEKIGRYSFIGVDPEAILEYADGKHTLIKNQKKVQIKIRQDFLSVIQNLLNHYQLVQDPELPAFAGGFVGYIGYELVREFEDVKLQTKKGLSLPDAVFLFPRNLIAFDHIKHHLKLIHLAVIDGSPKAAYRKALNDLKNIEQKLMKSMPRVKTIYPSSAKTMDFHSNMTRACFEDMVKRAKKYIRAGDCIQVVLSQRFNLGKIQDDFSLYRTLRSLNPSPYMFYFKHPHFSLVGSSPEMLTKKNGHIAETKPIAGTRPRGKTEREDLAYENALRRSRKEMAEHLMLVDLGRNDLGRVAKSKSVRVEHFARVERYSHVMHLVSDVKASLKEGKTALDLLRATFPAGTLTGAPKIRAMQIIDELEPERRGPYRGSVGYFSLSGDMDMCITIRTIVIQNGTGYVQAGAGIVNDSSPAREYEETLNKAKALLQAVRQSKEMILP